MRRNHVFLSLGLVVLALTIAISSCKKDDPDLTLATLVAGTIDLNAAASPSDVPVNPAIVATFSTDIDPATAIAANITLTQDYDGTEIPLNITASGKTITIKPEADLSTGAIYILKFKAGLKSTADKYLTAFERNFTTIGTFAPAGVKAHWKFENDGKDETGVFNSSAAIDINYVDSRNANAGKAAAFNGTTSIIEVPNGDQLVNTQKFTISFWVKAEDSGKGHFVLGLGAFYGIQFEMYGGFDGAKFAIQYELEDGTTVAEDMWFPSKAEYNGNGGWQGWDFAKSIEPDDMIAMLKNKWLHITYTFDGESRRGILYYNGEKMKSFDFNLWPDGDAKRTVKGMKYGGVAPDVVNELAFGFIQSRQGTMWANEPWGGYIFSEANHFKGQLDDVRIYHKVLTPDEIDLMYRSEEKP